MQSPVSLDWTYGKSNVACVHEETRDERISTPQSQDLLTYLLKCNTLRIPPFPLRRGLSVGRAAETGEAGTSKRGLRRGAAIKVIKNQKTFGSY